MKRSRFGRMLQIVTALQSSHNNQIDDMAEMHQLSRRTIFRDLKELKEIGIVCKGSGLMRKLNLFSCQ